MFHVCYINITNFGVCALPRPVDFVFVAHSGPMIHYLHHFHCKLTISMIM